MVSCYRQLYARSGILNDAIIVGAGPAGLAAAVHLGHRGMRYEILEKTDSAATSWRHHYDRLHLHTPKRHSALPFLPYPEHYPTYPTRQQVVDYFDSYVDRFGLAPRLGETVTAARHDGSTWHVTSDAGTYTARGLVVATGLNAVPVHADWPGRDRYRGTVVHATDYQDGVPFRSTEALVVGFGNSGGEIALDLLEHGAAVHMAVRSPVNIMPRDVFGIPIVEITLRMQRFPSRWLDAIAAPIRRLRIGDLSRFGLQQQDYGPATQIRKRARIPLVDIGTIDRIKRGDITIHPGIERFTTDGVRFTDGTEHTFGAVVLATGYTPDLRFLHDVPLPTDPIDLPIRGEPGPAPNLFFSGFRVTATGTLREIGLEAERIAAHLGSSA